MIKRILIIAFVFFFIVPWLLRAVQRFFMGSGSQSDERRNRSGGQSAADNKATHKKKVIDKDEGEYVDYVEIK